MEEGTRPPRSQDGVRFTFRARPEDFIVEELAASVEHPDPAGSHVWFTVEKRDVSTTAAARRIARALGRNAADVHFAGRKDAVAVTRQRMSVEHVAPETLLGLDLEGIQIRDPLRCRRKIRLGQTLGNRFHLRLTDLDREARDRVAERLDVLVREGIPNAYGDQRFGADRTGIELGRRLVKGGGLEYLEALAERSPERGRDAARELVRRAREGSSAERRRASELEQDLGEDLRPVARAMARRRPDDASVLVRAVPKRTRSFHLAILQASVFNGILRERLRRGTATTVQLGDVVAGADGRHAIVTVERPAPDTAVPTGPLWGGRVPVAEGEPGEIERATLEAEGLEPGDLVDPGGLRPRGARRALVANVAGAEVEPWASDSAWVTLELPVGAYATVVLDLLAGRTVPSSRFVPLREPQRGESARGEAPPRAMREDDLG